MPFLSTLLLIEACSMDLEILQINSVFTVAYSLVVVLEGSVGAKDRYLLEELNGYHYIVTQITTQAQPPND